MPVEQTLTIIKPDAVAKNYIGKILSLIEENNLTIVATKMISLSVTEAKTLYVEHKERDFYASLLEYMTSGPIVICLLEGENTIARLRELMGNTVPSKANKGTIRELYAEHKQKGDTLENAIHGSDSVTSARREIDFFFQKDELCPRTR